LHKVNPYTQAKVFYRGGKKYLLPFYLNKLNAFSKSFLNIKKFSKDRIENSLVLKIICEFNDIINCQGKTYNFIFKE